jgi:hypothetical protein
MRLGPARADTRMYKYRSPVVYIDKEPIGLGASTLRIFQIWDHTFFGGGSRNFRTGRGAVEGSGPEQSAGLTDEFLQVKRV